MGEMLKIEDVMKESRKGWPTFDDLEKGEVLLDTGLIKKVEGLLQSNRRCLIRGAEGRGKTVLARVIGFNKFKENWKVYFIDIRELRKEDISSICRQIEAIGEQKTLFIIENAHASLDEITPKLIQLANNCQKPSFIFTLRKIFPGEESLLVINPFEEYEEKGWYVDLSPDLRMMIGIITTFISARNIPYSLTEEDKSWIKREFGEQKANLRRLRWHLETWSEINGPIHSVPKEEVLKRVLKQFLIREFNTELQKMLIKISAVFQFDVNFHGENFDKNILTELTERGVITFLPGNYYRMQHSSDAAYVIEAEAILREEKKPEVLTADILKEYLQKKPVNFLELMGAIYRNKQKPILSQIFKDQETYKAIFDMIKQGDIRAVSSLLGYITWACGKEKGLEFWSQYKKLWGDSPKEQGEKLKEKLTGASLIEVEFLLLFLGRVDANEKDWLATEALDKDVLVQKAKEASFLTILNLLRLLPDEKSSQFLSKLDASDVAEKAKGASFQTIENLLKLLPAQKASRVISKLDPNDVAEKAKAATAQSIMWFLKYCLQDPSNIGFVKSFLIILHKDGKLIEKLKDSELGVTLDCLSIIKNIDPEVYKDIKDDISPHWLQIWLSSSLSRVANQLYRYRWSVGEPKRFAQSVVNSLASKPLGEPIKRLYSRRETKPLKVLGKLLNSAYQVAFEGDKHAVERIAQQIVDNLNLGMQQRYTIEELSLLVSNVKRCSEEAYRQLCDRIVSELDLIDYISIPFDRGLAALIWDIYQYGEGIGQKLADEIFKLDFDRLLDNSETEAISRLLWNLLQINNLKVKNWIENIDNEKWLSKALLSSSRDAFWLLWSLYHADEEKGKAITCSLANEILPTLTALKVEDLPLLGFFIFCDISFDLNVSFPSPYEIAEKFSEKLSLSELAFCIYLLNEKNNKIIKEFLKELSRFLFIRFPTLSIQEIIEKYPFDTTKNLLMEILRDFNLPKEPDSTFAEMVSLTKGYLKERGKTKIAFSQLKDFFLKNPPDSPIFKSADDSTKWLNIAIEYGIYLTEQVPHYENPSWIVTLLSLNKDNSFVSSFLRK